MPRLFVTSCCVLFATAAWAQDPTFTTKIEPHSITVIAKSDAPHVCDLSVPFSYTAPNGSRFPTAITCKKVEIPQGTGEVNCSVTHPTIIDPKMAGPVKATCH